MAGTPWNVRRVRCVCRGPLLKGLLGCYFSRFLKQILVSWKRWHRVGFVELELCGAVFGGALMSETSEAAVLTYKCVLSFWVLGSKTIRSYLGVTVLDQGESY